VLSIDPRHPLRLLFRDLTARHFPGDKSVADYVAGMLTDFVHVENLYKIRDARGKRLEDVGEMLIESNPILAAGSFLREREVRKHIGDYTLFLTGLFPEYVVRLQRRGARLDSMVDYVKAGKESYYIVSCFDQFEFRDQAPLFRRLSDSFEWLVFGLNRLREDLQRLQAEAWCGWRDTLLGA
jgi:hypothetical protein